MPPGVAEIAGSENIVTLLSEVACSRGAAPRASLNTAAWLP
jgi:hypothetical protein